MKGHRLESALVRRLRGCLKSALVRPRRGHKGPL
jgi:hypothetical protein